MSVGKKKTQITSPGTIFQGGIILEEVKSKGGYMYAVKKGTGKPYLQGSFDLGDVIYYPMEKCPWKVASEPTSYDSEDSLFREIRDFTYDHLDVSKDDRYYDLVSSWTLADWVPENFNVAPYLHFHGPPNSGKSRALEILQALGYRALLSPSVSPASLYRTIEVFKPTFLIDEAELYTSKGLDETKREVLSVLNAGYRRGQVVIRADAKGETLRLFNVFGFKALGSIQTLPATLAGRSIHIPMMRATRKVKRRIDEEVALNIRNKLLMYRFNHVLEKPKEDLNPLDIPDGRLIEIFTPLILVAPNSKVESILVKLGEDLYHSVIEEERTSNEAQVFFAIIETMSEGMDRLPINDVVEKYNVGRPKKEQISNSFCGRLLKTLGFNKKRMPGTGRTAIVLDQGLVDRLKYRYGVSEQKTLPNPKKENGKKSVSKKGIIIRKFQLEDVIGCTTMKMTHIGQCAYNGEKPVTLTHYVKTHDSHYQICEDCAVKVNAYLKKRMEEPT